MTDPTAFPKARAATAAFTGQWRLDPHASTVRVDQKAMWGMATTHITFGEMSGAGAVDNAGAAGQLTMSVASVHSGMGARDKHLRSKTFFAEQTHPEVEFTVEGLESGDDGGLQCRGTLLIKGIARPLTVPVGVQHEGGQLTVHAETTVERSAFEMSYNFLGMIAKTCTVTADLVLRH